MKKNRKSAINIDKFEILDASELLMDINSLYSLSGEEDFVENDTPAAEEEEFIYSEDWLKSQDFIDEQVEEIKKGVEQFLPIEHYAKTCYNWMQMREIRLGLLQNLNTKYYENPNFSSEQMHQIRLGLEANLDIALYAKLSLTWKDMYKYRKRLLQDIYNMSPTGYENKIVDEDSGITIRISNNCMEAYISFSRVMDYSLFDIKKLLARYDIVFGLIHDNINNALKSKKLNKEFLVASGEKSQPGKDGYFEFFFNALLPGKPREMEDGSVDYTEIMEIDRIFSGAPLAKYNPAIPGRDGSTVTGIKILSKPGREYSPLVGKGFLRIPETNTYYATCDGFALADLNEGSLNVWNVYVVKGDVNRYTGHITYDGIIHIQGNVGEQSVIEATGNIVVDGIVEGAFLTAGKNVILKRGINGADRGTIIAGRKVMGKFFEAAKVYAGDDVEGNYFMNCFIRTDGRLIAKGRKGRIIGGNMQILSGVEAVSISNNNIGKTVLDVGNISHTEERKIEALNKLKKVEEELYQLELGKKKLRQMLGDDLTKSNELFNKANTAIEAIMAQKTELQNYILYIEDLVRRANAAQIIVYETLEEGVRVVINGHRKDIKTSTKGKKIIKREQKGV